MHARQAEVSPTLMAALRPCEQRHAAHPHPCIELQLSRSLQNAMPDLMGAPRLGGNEGSALTAADQQQRSAVHASTPASSARVSCRCTSGCSSAPCTAEFQAVLSCAPAVECAGGRHDCRRRCLLGHSQCSS